MTNIIRRLKIKFIALSMSSLLLLLLLIVGSMNMLSFYELTRDADEMINFLVESKDRYPTVVGGGEAPTELPYGTGYVTATLRDGVITNVDKSKLTSIGDGEVLGYIKDAASQGSERGFIGGMRYRIFEGDGECEIIMLDCSIQIGVFRFSMFTSMAISLIGYFIVFVVMLLLSERILRPVIESHEKQNRFITDASHEIKTPLTIINANADILEMDIGENDALRDIKAQTVKLSRLTRDLVSLSKMHESGSGVVKVDFPISEIISDVTSEFRAPVQASGRELCAEIAPLISAVGDASAIARLTSILLDNAMKYSPVGSKILLSLSASRTTVTLAVENETENAIDKRELPKLFDRFYRSDSSRNSETGGHGIGLSIAAMITEAHGGRIVATAEGEGVFRITVTLPQ